MTPKSLLRARSSRAKVEEFVSGTFREVLDDPAQGSLDASAVERVVCCSGKIAYEAIERRDALIAAGSTEAPVAVVRLEQLYPWPGDELATVLDRYPDARELVWLQDEPANMGAWHFVHERIRRLFGDRFSLRRVSRTSAGSPATGSHLLHELEVEYLLDESVGSLRKASA